MVERALVGASGVGRQIWNGVMFMPGDGLMASYITLDSTALVGRAKASLQRLLSTN